MNRRFLHSFTAFAFAVIAFTTLSHADINRWMEVEPGAVYRGSQPETKADYDFLREHGIKTIVNLRDFHVGHEQDRINGITDDKDPRRMGFAAAPFAALLFIPPIHAHVRKAFELITDPALQPVFFHCKLGRDRTGLMAALYRVHVQHWTPANAFAEMKSLGFNGAVYFGIYHYFWHHIAPGTLAGPADAIDTGDDGALLGEVDDEEGLTEN